MDTEADRHDLYHGLIDVLGNRRADTLMSYLPNEPLAALATRADLSGLGTRFEERMDGFDTRMDRFELRMDRFEERMDRFFHTMIAGLLGMIATAVAALLIV